MPRLSKILYIVVSATDALKSLLTTVHGQNRSLQASYVLADVMHSPESSRPFTLLHSMHALLTATVHRQNRSLQASCVLAVVHALIDVAAHCSQPLYTVKVGHCIATCVPRYCVVKSYISIAVEQASFLLHASEDRTLDSALCCRLRTHCLTKHITPACSTSKR